MSIRRRDVASVLGATAIVMAAGSQKAAAQSMCSTGPCYPLVSGESAAWITNYGYPPGDLRRYGADVSGVSASDTALQHALPAAQATTGIVVWHPGGTIYLTKTAVVPNGITISGADRTACIFLYGGTGSAFQNINGPNLSGYGRVIFRNVQIKAKALVSNGAGIEINGGGFSFYEIDTCQVTGPFQYGVILDACEVAHVHHNMPILSGALVREASGSEMAIWIFCHERH
jgi:hypothetical protein